MLNGLYPQRCPICDEILTDMDHLVCRACRKKLVYVKEPSCKICGKPILYENGENCSDCMKKDHTFTQGKAVFIYQKDMKQSMYRFKYANRRQYSVFYASEAARIYEDWIKTLEIDAIVPIPLHRKRRRKRGYNQAELVARELSSRLNIPLNTKCLYRIKNTKPQKELSQTERKNNLKSAFKTSTDRLQLRHILLIDDIYTTGSTLDAASKVLRKAGADDVYTLCICIGQTY